MKSKRFNIFDLLIIIVVIGIVVGIIFRAQIKGTLFSADSAAFTVTVDVKCLPNDALTLLTEGTELRQSGTGAVIGKVVSVTHTPVTDVFESGTGSSVEYKSEYFSSAVIVIDVNGYANDTGKYTKSDVLLLERKEYRFETGDVYLTGTVTAITPVTDKPQD